MTAWEEALKFTLGYEGGYANSPWDAGGETFRGISRRFWGSWEGWVLVDQIRAAAPTDFRTVLLQDQTLLQEAMNFYRRNFWDQINGDALPHNYAIAAFDMAVHSGVQTAVRILQYSVKAHVDGVVGPRTVQACLDAGEPGLITYLAARAKLLHEIMVNRDDQKVWAMNWFKRLFKLADIVLENEA